MNFYRVVAKNGKAQIQRKNLNGSITIITGWKLVAELDMPKLEEYVRMANAGQKVAFAQAYGMFHKMDKYHG